MVSELSKEQIASYKEAFLKFASEKDKTVNIDGLKAVLKSVGENLSEKELEDLIKEVDIERRAILNLQQFLIFMSNNERKQMKELLAAFQAFDKENTGCISLSLLRTIMMELQDNMTKEEFDDIVCEADPLDEGKVNYETFIKVMKRKC